MDDTAAEQFTKMVPLGRIGKPKDIAGAVVYLASEDSGYVTGQDITVDSGYPLR